MKLISAEAYQRSLVKSVSYRTISVITDLCVAYFFTRSAELSAGIVIFVDGYSTILYYAHERVWAHIHWGRKPVSR